MADPSRDNLSPVPRNGDGSEDDDVPRRPTRRKPPVRKPSIGEVFGDVLPDSTRDERGPEHGRESAADEKARDEDLLRDVPPHHS
jgi:hypothetical protein